MLLAVVVAAQCVLLVWHHGRDRAQPHRMPVVVAGPAVIAQSLAERLNHCLVNRSTRWWWEADPRQPA